MERDKKLEQLIKEHSLLTTPDNFTESVLGKIKDASLPLAYKPIIGLRGRIFIIFFIIAIVVSALFLGSGETAEPLFTLPGISDWKLHFPDINLKMPSAVLAGLIAVLILVLTDAGLNRSKT